MNSVWRSEAFALLTSVVAGVAIGLLAWLPIARRLGIIRFTWRRFAQMVLWMLPGFIALLFVHGPLFRIVYPVVGLFAAVATPATLFTLWHRDQRREGR